MGWALGALRVLLGLAAIALCLAVAFDLSGGGARPAGPVAARHGMVVAAQQLGAEVGRDVLRRGGNAVDAAVAVAYALAVVEPCCGNLGGGGFMLLRRADGEEHFLNFRERAPLAARRDMYLDDQREVIPGLSVRGFLAVATPGTVMGLEHARQAWGTMRRETLLEPAIRLAETGFVLSEADAFLLRLPHLDFAIDPAAAAIFLDGGKPYAAGSRLVQRDLAATLRSIARDGTEAFYRGPLAEAIHRAMAERGGILTRDDLAQYFVTEEPPVHCRYRGYEIASAPPPSSGGTALCEILNVLEGYPLGARGFHSADTLHWTIEAERQAFADRNAHLGDPAFVENPVDLLTSRILAAAVREQIPPQRARASATVRPWRIGASKTQAATLHEGESTTHFSIVDAAGNAVALTYTINAYFGAQVVAGDTGILLNDEMDDFSAKPGSPNLYGLVEGVKNAIAPGKRPLSSMSPTIVSRDGKTFLVLGSPGGSRIITITLGVLQNVVDYGMNVQQAVDAPRVHHQWQPDTVEIEPGALPTAVRAELERRGYEVAEQSREWGAAESILVDAGSGILYGASDRRRPNGAAAGW